MSNWRPTKDSPFVNNLTNCPDFMQVEFFLAFKESHPQVQIRQRAFEKLKPYFLRKLQDRYTRCCIMHVQMSFLRDALNHSRQVAKGVHGKECACRCDICGADEKCRAHTQTYSSLTNLWEFSQESRCTRILMDFTMSLMFINNFNKIYIQVHEPWVSATTRLTWTPKILLL